MLSEFEHRQRLALRLADDAATAREAERQRQLTTQARLDTEEDAKRRKLSAFANAINDDRLAREAAAEQRRLTAWANRPYSIPPS